MGDTAPTLIDRVAARLLQTPWLTRLPIGLYRAGLGGLFGSRLVMIEHLGRSSGSRRFVVLEVLELDGDVVRVASGLGEGSQWYLNLRANGVAFVSIGWQRRVPTLVRLLDQAEGDEVLSRYATAHPDAWGRLKNAMDAAAGGEARIPIVELTMHRESPNPTDRT